MPRRYPSGWACPLLAAALLFTALPAQAQDAPTPVPENTLAETLFTQALQAYQLSDYATAYRTFLQVINNYPVHRRTTAAALMAGKALYNSGAYDEAVDWMDRFIETYPTSSYVDEARLTRDQALATLAWQKEEPEVLNLGIALPLGSNYTPLTQAFFNGLRLAVDAHNATPGQQRLVRMIFRDTGARPNQAAQAISDLIEADADVIIGPLFSDEARAAAARAEERGVVLVAPMATDEDVSGGRRFVFQINPTFTMRGRLMARFAIHGLRLNAFGILAELGDSYGELMAEGFQDEALILGKDVKFFNLLTSSGSWYRLADELTADTLSYVDALFLPISASNAASLADAALEGLGQLGSTVRVLGNKSWHNLPLRLRASNHQTTYSNDFYPNPENPDLAAFNERYTSLTGNNLNTDTYADEQRLAYTGYDVTSFVLRQMDAQPALPLTDALNTAPLYEGLATRIDFQGGNVNQAMFYHRYRDGRIELLH